MTLCKMASNRLQKELREFQENPLFGITVKDSDNLKRWVIEIIVPPGTIYSNQTFQLQMIFPDDYPMHAPQVMFLPPVPLHPNICRRGHTCVDALNVDWIPGLSVKSICLSIVSMLSSSEQLLINSYEKERRNGRSPKKTRSRFHSRL